MRADRSRMPPCARLGFVPGLEQSRDASEKPKALTAGPQDAGRRHRRRHGERRARLQGREAGLGKGRYVLYDSAFRRLGPAVLLWPLGNAALSGDGPFCFIRSGRRYC